MNPDPDLRTDRANPARGPRPPRLILENLVKRRGDVPAVDGASLEVRTDELMVVLGPAGSGKTTLARLVVGLETPDEGEVYVDNRLVHRLPVPKRGVALVPPANALRPGATVGWNVELALRLAGEPRRGRKDRVMEALALVGVESLARARPENLSPLQRLKVAIARAVARKPALLLLDDPWTSIPELDPRARAEFRDELRRVHAEAALTTLVFAEDPREALPLADRLAVLDLGRVVQVGHPREVYARPRDTLVAQLLGRANLLRGRSEGETGRDDGLVLVQTPVGRLAGRPADPARELPRDEPVAVVIRPEALRPADLDPDRHNRFPAVFDREIDQGSTRLWELRGPGGWPVALLVIDPALQTPRPGETLPVSVRPEDVVVLPARPREFARPPQNPNQNPKPNPRLPRPARAPRSQPERHPDTDTDTDTNTDLEPEPDIPVARRDPRTSPSLFDSDHPDPDRAPTPSLFDSDHPGAGEGGPR